MVQLLDCQVVWGNSGNNFGVSEIQFLSERTKLLISINRRGRGHPIFQQLPA